MQLAYMLLKEIAGALWWDAARASNGSQVSSTMMTTPTLSLNAAACWHVPILPGVSIQQSSACTLHWFPFYTQLLAVCMFLACSQLPCAADKPMQFMRQCVVCCAPCAMHAAGWLFDSVAISYLCGLGPPESHACGNQPGCSGASIVVYTGVPTLPKCRGGFLGCYLPSHGLHTQQHQ